VDWSLHLRRVIAHPLLGDDATFTHGTSQASSVKGRFAAPYQLLPNGLDTGFASSEPRFCAMSADIPSAAAGDTLAVLPVIEGVRGTVNYTIVGLEPDAFGGFTVLQLQKTT
jgi:hypothetical protein